MTGFVISLKILYCLLLLEFRRDNKLPIIDIMSEEREAVELKVIPLDADHEGDFYKIHCDENNTGWCYCVAWWTTTWEAWSLSTAEENRIRRENLFGAGQYDGYLLYVDDKPAGWCQVGPRDRLVNLCDQYKFAPDPDVWAITCFLLLPKYREIGLAHYFLKEILKDLSSKKVMYVQGFPRRGHDLSADNVWTGPESVFQKAGFILERDDPLYPIYGKQLSGEPEEDQNSK